MLAIGGLTVAGNLNYSTVSLNGGRITNEKVKAIFAADAGIENTMWRLLNGYSPETHLEEPINGMNVSITTQNEGNFTLYAGDLIEPGEHFTFITFVEELVWDSGANAYRYTITVTYLDTGSTVHINEVGARLPRDFVYVAGSASGNMSLAEPSQMLDGTGAVMVRWIFTNPGSRPTLKNNATIAHQTFYITGPRPPEGQYAWIVADRTDIGAVGVTGGRYIITAEARRVGDNKLRATVRVDVILVTSGTSLFNDVITWKVLN